MEDLLAMKDTARSADLQRKLRGPDWTNLGMEKVHRTVLVEAENGKFQAICLCGWLSQVTFLEEADLLRALHAHEAAVFGER